MPSKSASQRPSGNCLGPRALNRALLERQMLLRRAQLPVVEILRCLVGMQAQVPDAPYVGLWTRLRDFRPEDLAQLLTKRGSVRAPLMRATLHLVTTEDFLSLRPVVQPVLERGFYTGSPFGRNLAGMDVAALLQAGRGLVEQQPRTRAELARLLSERWPGRDPSSLAHAITHLLPLLQVPPRGIRGSSGQARWTTIESWVGRTLESDRSADEMIMRYLAAFGPATVRDLQAWSGLTRLREAIEQLGDRLCRFHDQKGIELFDLPEAPRPDADTPAPPRYLPEFDNVLVAYADRARITPEQHRRRVLADLGRPMVLVDGFTRGTWKIVRVKSSVMLTIVPFGRFTRQERDTLIEEGTRLLDFAAPEATSRSMQFSAQ